MEKVCNVCKISKPLSEFTKNKHYKDGLQYTCKECNSKYYNKRKSKIGFKEDKAEYNKKWRENNRTYGEEYNQQVNMSEGYGVYKLTHLPTQYFYIGEGKIYSRRHKHFSLLKKGDNPYGLLQEHYNKHPNIDEWQFKVIYKFDDYDKETGKELEAFIIEESREKYPTQILNKKS
jgi:hypothetical protein